MTVSDATITDTQDFCLPTPGAFWFGIHPPDPYHRSEMDITPSSIQSITRTIGKTPAIITFSHEWGINKSFPSSQFSYIHSTGATPWVRLMLRTEIIQNIPEPVFTLNRIINGAYDDPLRSWAQKVRELRYPVIIEYGTEVNGKWFSWNGYWTGNDQGPKKFQEAYRHIHRLMDNENATNLIWVYHVNWHNNPEEPWNTVAAYYPGDDYVDMFGISVYGALGPNKTEILPFFVMMNQSYNEVMAINSSKPVIIAEIGTDIHNQEMDPVTWMKDAVTNLTDNTWPKIIGFVWWNSEWPNDQVPAHNTSMRIEDDSQLQRFFWNSIGENSHFLNKTNLFCI